MDYDNDIVGIYDLEHGKHCNECGAHWIPDDDEDPDQFVHCVECGSDDIETCDDPLCAKSTVAEENREYAYAKQDYPGRLAISKRKNKKGEDEDFVEMYFKVSTGEELRLGDYDKNKYRLIGVGLKGMEAVVALWITPDKRSLKMDAGVSFKSGSPYFEGYAGNDVDKCDAFPDFRTKFATSDNPKGTRTSLSNYDQVVELFNAVCDRYGCKKEPRIWSGAERAVEDAKAAAPVSSGGGKVKVKSPIEILEMQFAEGKIDEKAFIAGARKLAEA